MSKDTYLVRFSLDFSVISGCEKRQSRYRSNKIYFGKEDL